MLKRIAAAIIAAAMVVSAVPVMAQQKILSVREISFEVGLFNNPVEKAELFSARDEFCTEIVSQIEKKQVQGEKTTIVVDELEKFGLDSGDAQYVVDQYVAWMQQYNMTSAKIKFNKRVLESITFEVDNSKDIDAIVKEMSDKAAEKFDDPQNYNKTGEVFTELPLATFIRSNQEILARLQFARPELCYVQISSVSMGADPEIKQTNTEIEITTNPSITLSYLPIDADEYKAFEKKLDDIVDEVVYPDMTDAQKAMALHDWVIDNVKYGYRLNDEIYSDKPTAESNVIFELASYENLMEKMKGTKKYDAMLKSKMYAHTAYGPAMFGYGVCQGYTMLYAALLDKVGIENGTYVSNTLNHQWSLVEIDGQWYHTDVTWGDPTPPIDGTGEGYEELVISMSGGKDVTLYYQTEDYHYYTNFLMSEARSIDEGHIEDPTAFSIPDVECEDDKFHADDIIDADDYSHYAFDQVYFTKLNYCGKDKMYYYERDVRVNGKPDVYYYRLPFYLKNEDGTFIEAEQVTKEEFNEAISSKKTDDDYDTPDDPKDPDDKPDDTVTPPDYENYVTVQIPDETVIDNSVNVECRVDGALGSEELSMENIGTSVVKITAKEDAEAELAAVDAYLVYYGENNAIMDIVVKTVGIKGSGDVQFDGELPEGAVEAKIIILDADSELVPVIKALGVTSVIPEEPAA